MKAHIEACVCVLLPIKAPRTLRHMYVSSCPSRHLSAKTLTDSKPPAETLEGCKVLKWISKVSHC
eukprot:1154915-Pelagomonas_calceolata.AAC.4